MSRNEKFVQRYNELEREMGSMRLQSGSWPFYLDLEWRKWATSAQNLISASTGKQSAHSTNFNSAYEHGSGLEDKVNALKGIFLAAKEDYLGGHCYSLEATISGEIFGDFISLAKTSLSDGAKDVAAVLACAALEDALKRFALLNGLDLSGKEMQEVVNALKSKGLVNGAQKTLLDTMPKIRNLAMHAEWSKISPQDVASVLGYVEQFLLSNF